MFCIQMASFGEQPMDTDQDRLAVKAGIITPARDCGDMPTKKQGITMNITDFMIEVVGSRDIDNTAARLAKDNAARCAVAGHWHRYMSRCASSQPPLHPRIAEGRLVRAMAEMMAGRPYDDEKIPQAFKPFLRAGLTAAFVYWTLATGRDGMTAKKILEDVADYADCQKLWANELNEWRENHGDQPYECDGYVDDGFIMGLKARDAFLNSVTGNQWKRIEATYHAYCGV